MNDDSNNAADIWQKQTTEGLVLSPDEIRRRVERSRLRVQRQRTICGVAAGIMLLNSIAIVMFMDTSAVTWLRGLQALVWVVLLGIGPQVYEERKQLLTLGLTSSPVPCLDFYQRELERHRDSLRPIPWLMICISVFGLALATFVPKHRSTAVPVGILMIIIAVVFYARMRWQAPGIERELQDLRRIKTARVEE
jgi:hypothetical protein